LARALFSDCGLAREEDVATALAEPKQQLWQVPKSPDDPEADRIFHCFDKDNSGTLDFDELRVALIKLELPVDMEQSAAVLVKYDQDRSGSLDIAEFRRLVHELRAFKASFLPTHGQHGQLEVADAKQGVFESNASNCSSDRDDSETVMDDDADSEADSCMDWEDSETHLLKQELRCMSDALRITPTYSQVFISPAGDWTKELSRYVQSMSSTKSSWVAPCWVQGPFTSPFNVGIGYGRLILVASGIGLSAALPLVQQLRENGREVFMVWITRSVEQIAYQLPMLLNCTYAFVYYTGRDKLSERLSTSFQHFVHCALYQGRPDMQVLIDWIVHSQHLKQASKLNDAANEEKKRLDEVEKMAVKARKIAADAAKRAEETMQRVAELKATSAFNWLSMGSSDRKLFPLTPATAIVIGDIEVSNLPALLPPVSPVPASYHLLILCVSRTVCATGGLARRLFSVVQIAGRGGAGHRSRCGCSESAIMDF